MKLSALMLIVAIILVQTAANARAQMTRLFTLSNVQQSIDTSYNFDAHQGAPSSSLQHDLQENYHFGIGYAVYKARLLHGQIVLDLQGNQRSFRGDDRPSDRSNGVGLYYDVNGIFLDRLPYPINFAVSSRITEVPREYASNFQQKVDSYRVGVSLSSKLLPVTFNYNRSTSETAGLDLDRLQVSDSMSFGVMHHHKQLSQSQFTVANTSQSTATKGGAVPADNGNVDAFLRNTLDFSSSQLHRTVKSRMRINKQTGLNESRTTEFGQSLQWDLGKGLDSGLDYSYNRRETFSRDQHMNMGRLWVEHRLFKSLTSRLELLGSDNHLPSGSEKSASGTLSLAYQKILPAESMIQLHARKDYGVTTNRHAFESLQIINEAHEVSATTQLLLRNSNVMGSIVVRNADPHLRAIPYELDKDYLVRPFGTRTEIYVFVEGSEIQAKDQLVISYEYFVNANIKYSNSTLAMSGDLSLYGNKYRLFANWDVSQQGLLSGSADRVNLASADSFKFGMERRFQSGSLMADYFTTSSDLDRSQVLTGRLLYGGSLAGGTYSLTLNDSYITTERTSAASIRRTLRNENVLSVGGNYNRSLPNSAMLNASTHYRTSTGFSGNDHLSVALGVRWNLRRASVSVLTQENFRFNSGGMTSDEHLQLRLSRNF